MGLEPTIFRFEVGRLIRWATRPQLDEDWAGASRPAGHISR